MAKPKKDGVRPLSRQMFVECDALAKYAFASGVPIPARLLAGLSLLDLEAEKASTDDVTTPENPDFPSAVALGPLHIGLAKLVSPATPRGIIHLAEQGNAFLSFLGSVPLVRQLMGLAFLSLFLFVGISLSPMVDSANMAKDLLTLDGMPLLLNQAFLLVSAAMGASFSGLFQANRHCVQGRYDPKYDSSYWVRFVLGLISGLTLAELLSVDPASAEKMVGGGLSKPLLAMLGGFSSDLVYRLLRRLVDTVESLVKGSTNNIIQQHEQRAQDQAANNLGQDRLQLASSLMRFERKMLTGAEPDTLSAELRETIDRLLNGETIKPGSIGGQE